MTGRIELHVERIPGGFFSEWIHDSLRVGDTLTACGATGELIYNVGSPRKPLLMAGWNGGLGALIGVMQDAFENDHQAPVYMFHGATDTEHLYWVYELREASRQLPNFHYVPCVKEGAAPDGYVQGSVQEQVGRQLPDLTGWKVFLCGSRNEAHALQAVTDILRGMGFNMANLHSESFGTGRVAQGAKGNAQDLKLSGPLHKVTFTRSGLTVDTVENLTLLELAEAHGIEIGYACRIGSCGECEAKCRGEIVMDKECAIDAKTRDAGFVYACCSTARSDLEIEA